MLALWSLCLLSVFSVMLGFGVRQKLILSGRMEAKDKLRFIAEAGLKKAVFELARTPVSSYDSLNDAWSNNPDTLKEIPIGEGSASVYYNIQLPGTQGDRYGFVDEESKINLNRADMQVLERLFQEALGVNEGGLAEELAASIVDWRDADSQLSIPLGSAEDAYYRNSQFPYEAKDAEFDILEEALLVKDMSQEIFDRVKDYITVYGSGKVNVNTASKPVLMALGMNEETAGKLISYRLGEDGILGTPDDNIFYAADEVTARLARSYDLSDPESESLKRIESNYLVTNSQNFTAKSSASLKNSKYVSSAACVVDRAGKILYWQEF